MNSGCDFVHVAHKDFKYDELQWRISFSRAEVILIRSCIPTQQIVYHMLRYFLKQQLLQKELSKSDEILCGYHIKTLLLWSCEKRSLDWWESNSVINICSDLLQELKLGLENRHLEHYFIPEWNLFDSKMNENKRKHYIEELQQYSNKHILTNWFISNYLRRKPDVYKKFLSGDMPPTRFTLEDLQYVCKINNTPQYFDVSNVHNLNKKVCSSLIRHKLQIGAKKYYDLACVLLHIATFIQVNGKSSTAYSSALGVIDEFLKHVSSYKSCHKYFIPFAHCSKWHYVKGKDLLANIMNEKDGELFGIRIQLCVRFFKAGLKIEDEFSESIRISSNVYLAALYFVRERFETSLKFVTSAMEDISKSNNSSSDELDGHTLLFCDEVSIVCGFRSLYSYVSEEFNRGKDEGTPNPWNFGFSNTFYACYLSDLLRRLKHKHSVRICSTCVFGSISDRVLWIVSFHRNQVSKHEHNGELLPFISNICSVGKKNYMINVKLEEMLIKLSCEYLTKHHKAISDANHDYRLGEWGICKIYQHYQLLYLYKGKQHDKVIERCNQIERECNEYRFRNTLIIQEHCANAVSMFHPFKILFSHEISVLMGFICLVDRGFFQTKVYEIIQSSDTVSDYTNQLASDTVLQHDQRCLVQPGFLILYLKLQCLIKTNSPRSEILHALQSIRTRIGNGGFFYKVFETILILSVTKCLCNTNLLTKNMNSHPTKSVI